MIALIDGDILLYRVGFGYENQDLNLAKWQMDKMLNTILDDLGGPNYEIWIKGKKKNFRLQYDTTYKANRGRKPKWYGDLYLHLVKEWKAKKAKYGYETDDWLAIRQVENTVHGINTMNYHSTIVSIDKDLHQVPGVHYNFVKDQFTYISIHQGWYNLYTQVLTGDTADNVKGCRGIGTKKAKNILGDCTTRKELEEASESTFKEVYGEEGMKEFEKTCNLLYLLRNPYDKWERCK